MVHKNLLLFCTLTLASMSALGQQAFSNRLQGPSSQQASAIQQNPSPAEPQALNTSDALSKLYGTPDILLPRHLYVLRGENEQYNLYHLNVLTGQWPALNTLDWESKHGKQLIEAWRLQPSSSALPAVPEERFLLQAILRDLQWNTLKTQNSMVHLVTPERTNTPISLLSIGDSISHQGYWQLQLSKLQNIRFVGTRLSQFNVAFNKSLTDPLFAEHNKNCWSFYEEKAIENFAKSMDIWTEARGGWRLEAAASSFLNAGSADGNDSPFMFPQGIDGSRYRGNVVFWRKAVQVDQGTINCSTDPAQEYAFQGFGKAAREGGSDYQYDVNTGYPLHPQTGWVVFDPSRDRGQQFQEWNGERWQPRAVQPSSWTFDFSKYISRNSWAFVNQPPTHVTLLLGTNDWFNHSQDPSKAEVNLWLDQYQKIIENIQGFDPHIKVVVLLPSLGSDQNGIGAAYGTRTSSQRLRRTYQQITRALLNRFDTETMTARGVFVSVFGAGIDPVLGWKTGDLEPIHKYARDHVIARTVDGIHPSAAGLAQAGDWVAALIEALR